MTAGNRPRPALPPQDVTGTYPGNPAMPIRHAPQAAITPRPATAAVRLSLLLAALMPLSGCLLGGGKDVSLYAPQLRVEARPDWPEVAWPLVVARPLCSDALDSDHIAVRPQAQTLQVYAGALWSDPVPDLWQGALVRAFEDSGRIAAVSRQSAGLCGAFALHTDIRQFEAVYADAAAAPTVTLSVQAKLLAQSPTRVVAMRRFEVAVPAAGKDVPVVVAAFGEAMTQLNQQVIAWTLATGQAHARDTDGAK